MPNIGPLQNLSAYNTKRFQSNSIWQRRDIFDPDIYRADPTTYVYWFDDFEFTSLLDTTALLEQLYTVYIDTGNTVRMIANESNRGVLRIASDGTENDGPVLSMCGNVGNSVCFDDATVGSNLGMLFEARWRISSITLDVAAYFIGFTTEGKAADCNGTTTGVLTDDAGTLTGGAFATTMAAVGFRKTHAANLLDFAWQKSGQATQTIAGLISTSNSAAAAIAAATWYRTGWIYDPRSADINKRMTIVVNGAYYTTFVTATQMAAATFPGGVPLVFTAALKTGNAAAVSNFDLDWIRIAQEKAQT